jgi:hypothetical protein
MSKSYMFLGHATRSIIYPSSSGSLVKSLRPNLSADLQREDDMKIPLSSLALRVIERKLTSTVHVTRCV